MSEPRYRVVDGVLCRRHETPYAYDLKIHRLGHHYESVASPRYGWAEVDSLSPGALTDAAMAEGNVWVNGAWEPAPPPAPLDVLFHAAENRERSVRRARAGVRKRVKCFGLNEMITLTYAENMLDRARIRRDVDVLFKRIRRVIPSFEYVCVFEPQERGAWHAHIACHRIQSHYLHRGVLVKSYDLLRSFWYQVTGGAGGRIRVGPKEGRPRAFVRSPGKLAGYLQKYIGKGVGVSQVGGDSYSSSGSLPKPEIWRYNGTELLDASAALKRIMLGLFPGNCEFYEATIDDTIYYCSLSPP